MMSGEWIGEAVLASRTQCLSYKNSFVGNVSGSQIFACRAIVNGHYELIGLLCTRIRGPSQ